MASFYISTISLSRLSLAHSQVATSNSSLSLRRLLITLPASQSRKSTREYEELLKLPLRSHYTGKEYNNLPLLKEHLEEEWARRGQAAREAAPAAGVA